MKFQITGHFFYSEVSILFFLLPIFIYLLIIVYLFPIDYSLSIYYLSYYIYIFFFFSIFTKISQPSLRIDYNRSEIPFDTEINNNPIWSLWTEKPKSILELDTTGYLGTLSEPLDYLLKRIELPGGLNVVRWAENQHLSRIRSSKHDQQK